MTLPKATNHSSLLIEASDTLFLRLGGFLVSMGTRMFKNFAGARDFCLLEVEEEAITTGVGARETRLEWLTTLLAGAGGATNKSVVVWLRPGRILLNLVPGRLRRSSYLLSLTIETPISKEEPS